MRRNYRYPNVAANTNPIEEKHEKLYNKDERLGVIRGAEFDLLDAVPPDGEEAGVVGELAGTELVAVLKPDVESCPTMLVLVIALVDW